MYIYKKEIKYISLVFKETKQNIQIWGTDIGLIVVWSHFNIELMFPKVNLIDMIWSKKDAIRLTAKKTDLWISLRQMRSIIEYFKWSKL